MNCNDESAAPPAYPWWARTVSYVWTGGQEVRCERCKASRSRLKSEGKGHRALWIAAREAFRAEHAACQPPPQKDPNVDPFD